MKAYNSYLLFVVFLFFSVSISYQIKSTANCLATKFLTIQYLKTGHLLLFSNGKKFSYKYVVLCCA